MARLVMILLSLFIWREDAAGASYYISPTGSDANTCAGQTDALACATFPRCAAVMSPGDTCYALDGTYLTGGTTKGWQFNMAGGSGPGATKRFTSLSQDPTKVIIKPSAPQDNNNITVTGGAGSQGEYFEFDHLTMEGRSIAENGGSGSTDGLSIHHNILRCPDEGEGNSGNEATWYFYGTADDLLDNGKFYENYVELASDCSDQGPLLGGDNIEWLGSFYTQNLIVEKNDFRNNSATGNLFAGFLLKRGDHQAKVRQNFFKMRNGNDGTAMWILNCLGDLSGSPACLGNAGPAPYCGNEVYQNVFINSNPNVDAACSKAEKVYNNTVITPANRCLGVDTTEPTVPENGRLHEIFNNICYCTSGCVEMVAIPFYGAYAEPCVSYQTTLDYNIYYPDTKSNGYRDCGGFAAGNLTDWKTHLAGAAPSNPGVRETNSRNSNPMFVNPGSENFRLQSGSPARTGGRGAGYPAMLGAYVTSDQSDQIGCSFLSTCYGYTAPVNNPRSKVR